MRFRWGHLATRCLWHIVSIKSECEAIRHAHAYNAFALYGYAVSDPPLVSAGSGGPPPAPIPALPGVLIRGELTPCGPLVSVPRGIGGGPGLAGAPTEVLLFCDCAVGTFILLRGLPQISGAKLLLLSLVSYVPGPMPAAV